MRGPPPRPSLPALPTLPGTDTREARAGSADAAGPRPDEWWEVRAEVAADAAEVRFTAMMASGKLACTPRTSDDRSAASAAA